MVEKSPDRFDSQEIMEFPGEENDVEFRRLFARHTILSSQLVELIAAEGKVIADAISEEDVLDKLMELAQQKVMLIKSLREAVRKIRPHLKRTKGPRG